MEKTLIETVAVVGPEGSYSSIAARNHYPNCQLVLTKSLDGVLDAVKQGGATFGLAPLENFNSGIIKEVWSGLFALRGELLISELCYLDIDLNLFSSEESLSTITQVASKDVALIQAKRWLDLNLTNATRRPANSTSKAVEDLISFPTKGAAAIGSKNCLSYGVPILVESIQTQPNRTIFGKVVREISIEDRAKCRFVLIGISDFQPELRSSVADTLPVDLSITYEMLSLPSALAIFEIGKEEQDANLLDEEPFWNYLTNAFLLGAYRSTGIAEQNLKKYESIPPPN